MLSALLLDKPCFSSVKVSLDPQTEVIKQFTTVEPRQCDDRWAIYKILIVIMGWSL